MHRHVEAIHAYESLIVVGLIATRRLARNGFLVWLSLIGFFFGSAQGTEPESSDAAQTPLPTGKELETQGAIIGEIRITNGNVFDTALPEENTALFRAANRVHIRTRTEVLRRQLLFKSGDRYSERLVHESARILRHNSYLYDAQIFPRRLRNGVVDLEVRTSDIWSLIPSITFGRRGGENSYGFELQEGNLLGYGKEVAIGHKQDVDRSGTQFRYVDPQLFGNWQQLLAAYTNNSDGQLREFSWQRPFYSLDSRWGASATALDSERTDQRYNLGQVIDEFHHHQEHYSLTGGWSDGWHNGWVRRWTFGITDERDHFAPTMSSLSSSPQTLPADHTFAYPFISFALLQDRFAERRNLTQIERTEDLYTGTSIQASLGWATANFGADRDAWLWSLSASTGFEWSQNTHTLLLSSNGAGRIEDGHARDVLVTADASYYWRVADHQLFYAALHGAASSHLDAEQQLLLGGDTGLRGYPLRYQDGSSQTLLTLEHRIYTKHNLFRLLNVGGAVFFDIGRVWGRGNAPAVDNINGYVGNPNQGVLKDIGFGLRLGSSRSGLGNVIHIDLAFPLDGDPLFVKRVQFVVETKRSF